MSRISRALLTMGALLATVPVFGQEHSPWPERVMVAVDVPIDLLRAGFSEALTFPDTIRTAEVGQFTADYRVRRGPLVAAGAAVRASKRIGVGATVSFLNRTQNGSFALRVPSPIAGNRPLDLNGSVENLERRELAVHLQTLYAVAISRTARVVLSAGPSIFHTRQDLVRSIEFDMPPGLTTVKLGQTLLSHATANTIGFNVAADVDWNFAAHVGVGAVVRYSRSNVRLDPGSASGVSRDVTLRAGGLQPGGGVRFRF